MNKVSFYLFALLHLLYLGVAIYENELDLIPLTLLIAVLIALLFFYIKIETTSGNKIDKKDLLEVLFCSIGALATFFLQREYDISAVVAAAVIGLVASLLPYIKRDSNFLEKIPAAVYCGTFVGMTFPGIIGSYLSISLAAIIAGFILIYTRKNLIGYGGKLGTVAFGGVTFAAVIIFLISL